MNNTSNKNYLLGAMGLAIAASIGTTLGIIFSPQKGENTRRDIAKKAQEITESLSKGRQEIMDSIAANFGEVNAEIDKNYQEIKKNIMDDVNSLRNQKKLNRARYQRVVNLAVKKYAKNRDWSKQVVRQLINNLNHDWEDIKHA